MDTPGLNNAFLPTSALRWLVLTLLSSAVTTVSAVPHSTSYQCFFDRYDNATEHQLANRRTTEPGVVRQRLQLR